MVSEEGEEQETGDTYWLIDPIDGTYDFIKKSDYFAVMVALIHKEKPILGIVSAPAREEVFVGGSLIGHSYQIIDGIGQNIKVAKNPHTPLQVAASRAHMDPKTESYLAGLDDYELLSIGSGLKFCYVANGSIDIYVRYQGTYEWDTAAPQAIVEAAGGKIEWEDEAHIYGKPGRLNKGFICTKR